MLLGTGKLRPSAELCIQARTSILLTDGIQIFPWHASFYESLSKWVVFQWSDVLDSPNACRYCPHCQQKRQILLKWELNGIWFTLHCGNFRMLLLVRFILLNTQFSNVGWNTHIQFFQDSLHLERKRGLESYKKLSRCSVGPTNEKNLCRPYGIAFFAIIHSIKCFYNIRDATLLTYFDNYGIVAGFHTSCETYELYHFILQNFRSKGYFIVLICLLS